jgi:hypothetical protein
LRGKILFKGNIFSDGVGITQSEVAVVFHDQQKKENHAAKRGFRNEWVNIT